ncbi:MAG: HAMP domain-containing histidine kinase, partial [Erysipelotrichaceae bacterium]|nr:HAMP domain-containing histidine kinase [Erysipelotrichaceae bacterium]
SEMMRDLPGENTPENAQVILDEAHRLSLLVNDLLDLSRFESHQVTLNKEIVQMNELLKSIVNRYQKYMDSEGFELNLTCDDVSVYSDSQRLSQVLYNFINNAIQYSGNSRQIEIRCQKINESVRVEIQDFGEGIPSDQIPYIWDRYYKIDRTHVRTQKGSGIGLNICKEILELHHSKYGVISKLNEGTTFWFELPCVTKQL